MAKKREHFEEDSAFPDERKTRPGGDDPSDTNQSADSSSPQAAGTVFDTKSALEDRIKQLEEESSDLKDKLLRKQADFENFRKRMFRERDEAARYTNAAVLSDIIGIIDDFERAIRSAEESKDFTSFLTGVSMIEKQLVEILETRWGLKRFISVGESFDPNKHEAVLRVEGPADSQPTVVEDYQKGYFLHERVLRPAKVKVMVPASAGPADEQRSDGGTPAPGSDLSDGANPSGHKRPQPGSGPFGAG
jgi:molecular chaperone GrpE